MSWDVTSPGDSDVVSQYPANERAARLHAKTAFGVDHHEAEDANIGKHDQVTFVDLVSDPTYATGQVGLWNNAGVLKYRVASGTAKSVAAIEDTVAKAGDTMSGSLNFSTSGGDIGVQPARTDGATTRLRAGATTGFVGTVTEHPFDIRSFDELRVRLHTDGGITVPSLLASGSQGDGTLNATELYEDGVRATAFPAGTRMVFQQNTAPAGWLKDVALPISSAFRYVHTVSGGGTGGSKTFSSVFVAGYGLGGSTDGHAITTSEMPSHSHTVDDVVDGAGASTGLAAGTGTVIGTATALATGSGGAHTHGLSGGTVDLDVRYIDVIIAEKS